MPTGNRLLCFCGELRWVASIFAAVSLSGKAISGSVFLSLEVAQAVARVVAIRIEHVM